MKKNLLIVLLVLVLLLGSEGRALTWMREIKQCTPEKLTEWAEMLQKLADEGGSFTAGGASAVRAEADRYDQILDPFGTEDR